MTTIAGSRPIRAPEITLRAFGLPLALLLVVLLAVPMLVAPSANLTSDESLYLAEAYAIAHGDGAVYPSGDAVTHRAPLYPLLLAPAVRLGGDQGAHRVSEIVVVLNAAIVLLLVWRMAGALAGTIAGVAASASAYLNGLGTTLYLDPLQCTFVLLSLWALYEAVRAPALRWFIASGLMLGLAFLVKESAVQWAPLGVIAWLAIPPLRTRLGARGALAFSLVFTATVAGWWLWVWTRTGEIYMLGSPSPFSLAAIALAAVAVVAFAIAIAKWPDVSPRMRARLRPVAPAAAWALVLLSSAFMLYGLTRFSTWPFPNDYARNIPRYLNTVAPQAQPYLLLAAAWCWVAYLSARRHSGVLLIALGGALFAPFAVFSANRGLQLRDALPLVYLSYAALGMAAAHVIAIARRNIRQPMGDALIAAALIAFGAAFAFQQAARFRIAVDDAEPSAVRPDSWENPFAQRIASWLETNLPEGANVLSSRLYFSSLYVQTGGRFRIRQLPTVRVDIDPGRPGLLAPRSNLFRWGDTQLRAAQPGDHWLYLKQFPVKDYWVGLSQEELLDYIGKHNIDYVVLTGEDAAFSSLSYAGYFSGHPAFKLRYSEAYSPSDQLFVYDVDRTKLAPVAHSTQITPASLAALEKQTRMDGRQLEAALGTPLHVSESDGGLSLAEQWAAIAGTDLGAR